ncbi:MAG: hypothetical protein ABIA66_00705 [Candidatus Omnitrophota bacterium]
MIDDLDIKIGITVGPWEAQLLDDISDCTTVEPVGFSYMDDHIYSLFQQGPLLAVPQERIHANARLMAAAPDLFEALIIICDAEGFMPDYVEAAIMKATGKTQKEIKDLR